MIVITAPTGLIGHQVLSNVLEGDEPIRVIVRDATKLPANVRERVEVVEGSHGDREVVDPAFDGTDAVFWLAPLDPRAASAEAAFVDFTRPACNAFTNQGVKRVVGISALGRGTQVAGDAGAVTATLAMDDLIASTGVSYRALANASFMDNILVDEVESIKSQGLYFSAISADRKLPAVATRDIASVAAELLLDNSWSGNDSIPLLGPDDLSPNDMAQIISEVLGTPVRYQQISGENLKSSMTEFGMSDAMAQSLVDMMDAKNAGLDDAEPRTSRSAITPTTFRQWCEDVLKPAVQQ